MGKVNTHYTLASIQQGRGGDTGNAQFLAPFDGKEDDEDDDFPPPFLRPDISRLSHRFLFRSTRDRTPCQNEEEEESLVPKLETKRQGSRRGLAKMETKQTSRALTNTHRSCCRNIALSVPKFVNHVIFQGEFMTHGRFKCTGVLRDGGPDLYKSGTSPYSFFLLFSHPRFQFFCVPFRSRFWLAVASICSSFVGWHHECVSGREKSP